MEPDHEQSACDLHTDHYYGNISTFVQSAGVLAPSNTNAFNVQNKTPVNYNLSFGIQQDLGFSTLLDISYWAISDAI